ncbi:MAG: SGNH/GDSL hydrolase family protein [Terracidiphilus sp.]
MNLRQAASFATAVAFILLAFTSIAQAGSFSSVIVYGDSLSDNGNLYGFTGQPISPPYYDGRFSNGPVTVERLAASLGAPLVDFAWGGATTGIGNYGDGGTPTISGADGLPGMLAELAGSSAYLTPSNLQNSLVVVWGGPDDYLTGGSTTQAVGDIDYLVATLEADGATHILVPGMPDLGLTPNYYGDSGATEYSLLFNAQLQASLGAGATYVDTFGLMHQIVNNPSAYGLTNVTTPCFNGATVCADPSQYLFWDGFHPTTTVDAIVAQDFQENITPEPSSILMLGTGIAGLAGLLRRRRSA